MSQIDYADVQGLVRFGYGPMTSASYVLVHVKNADAAKAWIRSAPITTAVTQKPPPKTALNIALTAPGLKALGVPESIIACFSHEFCGGMGQESRARQLGDIGKNAPSNWNWGSYGCEPHAVVMFFAEHGQLDSFIQKARDQNWNEAFEEVTSLGTSNLDGVEPFGFADGISQPQIDWEQQLVRPCTQLGYTNIVALGEFLLGYGRPSSRPIGWLPQYFRQLVHKDTSRSLGRPAPIAAGPDSFRFAPDLFSRAHLPR